MFDTDSWVSLDYYIFVKSNNINFSLFIDVFNVVAYFITLIWAFKPLLSVVYSKPL